MGAPSQTTESDAFAQWSTRLADLEKQVKGGADPNALSMIVFSGDLDKLLIAFVIATSAASCGMKVRMFFTFWGIGGLKKQARPAPGKTWFEWLFGWMMGGTRSRRLSKMHMGAIGSSLMKREMKKKRIADLPELIEIAQASEIRIDVCSMCMSLMGIDKEELIDYPDLSVCGMADFLESASASGTTLFV